MQKKVAPETLLMKNVAKIMLQISSHTRFKFMILSQKGKGKEMLFRNIFLILHTSELLSSKTNSQLSCYLSFCLGYHFLDKKGDKHAYIQSNGVAVQIFGVTTLPLGVETTVPKNKRNLRVAQKNNLHQFHTEYLASVRGCAQCLYLLQSSTNTTIN